VIRKDVPAGALALSMAAQRNAEGWVAANRPGTLSAELAEAAAAREGHTDSSNSPASTEEA
jgi:bifunctional UDP-N-acetylglucosamine pyrophosphorylase/glucosamine-1-phosphate N-acetyltransferase